MKLRRFLLPVCMPLLAVILFQQGTMERWNNQFYDIELNTIDWIPDENIVIVAIDKKSLNQLGHWPWSRRRHAQLIDILTRAEVAAIGLDIIFSEPDLSDPTGDLALATAMRESGRVILPVFPSKHQANTELTVTMPIPILAEAAAALGHVDIGADSDGIVRSQYLLAGIDTSSYWPAFSLAMLNLSSERTLTDPLPGERRPKEESSNHRRWSRDHRILFPFTDSNTQTRQISYSDILNDERISKTLRGKFVLVGVTAAGLAQTFATPAIGVTNQSKFMVGVELNARILDSLYSGLIIHPINPTFGTLLTLILVLIPIVTYSFVTPRWALMNTAIFSLLTFVFSLLLLSKFLAWYPPIPVVITLLLSYPLWSWSRLELIASALHEEKELSNATLHSIGDGVVTTNATGMVKYMNPIAEKLSGFKNAQANGQHIDEIFNFTKGDSLTKVKLSSHIDPDNANSEPSSSPRFLIDRNGQEYVVRTSARPIISESGAIFGTVFLLSDITETTQINRKMAYMATHDSLTRLPNRVLLKDRLSQAVSNAVRFDKHIAVLFIDLDGFKKVNDGMGHPVGDQLLKEVADRLRTTLRKVDTAARWGGDEFVIILESLSQNEAITNIAIKILKVLSNPFNIGSQDLFITPSIGISVFPKDGSTPEILLNHADAAMYRVKQSGSNNFRFFSEGINDQAKARLVMETDMHTALNTGEFEVFYQPQVELTTNRIVGLEALLRWHHPHKGMIPPNQFIPLAEDVGFIDAIGVWVLQTVCRQLKSWQEQGLPQITAAVNLSPSQFLRQDLVRVIDKTLNENDLNGAWLQIEITENLMMNDLDRVVDVLVAIKALGVSISIDDFGTGFSSLNFLKRFPIDELKIDISFVKNVVANPQDSNISKALIGLAHNMGICVVAEGVENTEQYRLFKQWGCDRIQGFYFSQPLASGEITKLIRSNSGIMTQLNM